MQKVIARQFIHSCHVKTKTESAVIVKEKLKMEDGTLVPNIQLFENPRRSFYITQPKHRSYNFKPEYELISKLDKYTVYDNELNFELAKILNLGPGFHRSSQLFKSPYIFGADISIEALIKMRYMNNYPENDILPSIGYLDIETSIDTDQIILISYLHDNVVHVAILNSFFFEEKDSNRIPIDQNELLSFINTTLEGRVRDIKFTYDIKVFDHEVKMIAWIAKNIHDSMIDYISIWNMNFDIPRILNCLFKHNVNASAIFHNPKISPQYRYLKYYEDKQKKAHFTLKWHWMYSSCGSQFVDSMGLYSQNRRTQGFLDKYTLDNVLEKEIQMGKLPLISGSHVIMQRHHFKEYIVYNIFDVIGLKFLEEKVKDFTSMHMLIGPSPVSRYASQTTRSTNDMYYDLINKGMVLSAKSEDDSYLIFDKATRRVGGAVLPPERVKGVGVHLTI